jgi:tRNA pseudouridine38-40 synthase
MHNIKLLIAYDGTRYHGWQDSIEKALQKIIEKICRHPIYLQAASRTDAGVHAYGQVVNFTTSKNLDLGQFQCSLNQLLPKDIVIKDVEYAPDHFHPTLDAKSKEYRYNICLGKFQLPHHRFYSWHVPQPLDFAAMETAASALCGKKDFSSFSNHRTEGYYDHCVREITCIEILKIEENHLIIKITGNNFLFRMVRNLVGTLVYIGRGKIALEDLPTILESRDRTCAGITAPAHGLFLHEVFY